MHSYINKTGPEQKRLREEHLAELAAYKQARLEKLANSIAMAVSSGDNKKGAETAEQYLERIGIDVTKI